MHGQIMRALCAECGHQWGWTCDMTQDDLCHSCATVGTVRPDVVWFGEPLGEAIERAFGCAAEAEVCVVVGTSAVVQPAAGVAMVTRRAGGVIIEVNPEVTPLTPMSEVSLRSGAAEAVPLLLASRPA